jgi:lysophospholipase L1-like esterase
MSIHDPYVPPASHFAGVLGTTAPTPRNAADILQEMSDTYRERNAVYGDNFRMVGPIMKLLFPGGVLPELLGSDQFHLFELAVVKMSRLAVSGLTHQDSARDLGVYAAMIESIINSQQKENP